MKLLPRLLHVPLIALALHAGSALGTEHYPSKPIQMIVAYPPGGGTDILARAIAAELGKELEQTVVVVNRGGASGAIGTEVAARAEPDGYTLLMATANVTINPAVDPKTRVDPARDFVPVTLLSESPFVLVSTPALPVKSLSELVQYTRANPGTVNFASTGVGSPQHLATEWLKKTAGLDWLHVPYQGGGPAIAALVGGEVHVMFSNVLPVLSFIESEKLRPLGVTTGARLPAVSKVPTMIEQGHEGFVVSFWSGVLAPAGTPAPIVDKLNDALMKIIQQPALRERLSQEGTIVTPLPRDEFGRYIAEDAERWARIARIADVRADR